MTTHSHLLVHPEVTKYGKQSASETGHAKNIANFRYLLAFVKAYGAAYTPIKSTLKIPQLEAILSDAEAKFAEVITQNTAYNNIVNERFTTFSGLESLSTQLVNALQATNASYQLINDAKDFNRKMQGQQVSTTTTTLTDPHAPVTHIVSLDQQSYTQQLQHLIGIIAVLKSEPSYAPNETELQITTLEAKQNELATKNSEVTTAYVSVSNSRIARNSSLYTNPESIFEVASKVKEYIKSIFGDTSPEFTQVKDIEFKKPIF